MSKKICEIAPNIYSYNPDGPSVKRAWIHAGAIENAWGENVGVKNCPCVGGGVDYWGEGQDYYTVFEHFRSHYHWILDFPDYPEGHRFEHMPDTGAFKPTTINLLRKLRECVASNDERNLKAA